MEKHPIDSIKSCLRAFVMTSQRAGEKQDRENNNNGLREPLPESACGTLATNEHSTLPCC
jgi:hypothetical protein